ncbi:MAG: Holliday junction resolvase RecU [Selenomonadaceae bacterium]|nr:Holliday junction resolvase RecU [Selenomonadaceae bacterium]
MNNSMGHLHEQMIEAACRAYADQGRAYIIKVPEPFRVITKNRSRGIATVQFTAHAQPDFMGAIKNPDGTSSPIAFEAKYTDTDRINQNVVTPTQAAALQKFTDVEGLAFVCAGISGKYFFIPWPVFSDMKRYYKHKYMTAADAEDFRVKFDGVIWFLDLPPTKKRSNMGHYTYGQ